MVDVAHLFNLFAQYGETSRDFLIRVRPRRFAQLIRTNEHEYLKPFQFLAISLVISAVFAFAAGVFVLAGSDREALFHLGVLGCLAIVVGIWIENLFVVAAAKVSAFALGISAPFSDLLDGYCYASVLFPLFIVATEVALLGHDQPSSGELLVALVVQLVFLGLACIAMASFVSMHPRYTWRVGLGTFLTIFVLSYLAFATIDDFTSSDPYEVHPLTAIQERLESSFLAPSNFPIPTCNTATLNGHTDSNDDHDEETVWFEWGETPALGKITVTQRFTIASDYHQQLAGLKANTKYFFRTVGSSKNGSFRGRVFSFTTARC